MDQKIKELGRLKRKGNTYFLIGVIYLIAYVVVKVVINKEEEKIHLNNTRRRRNRNNGGKQ